MPLPPLQPKPTRAALAFSALLFASTFSTAQEPGSSLQNPMVVSMTPPSTTKIAVDIDASKVREPISKYEYGMFIEHIGSLINHGLWAELLDDRKFYLPIQTAPLTTNGSPLRSANPEVQPALATMDTPFTASPPPRSTPPAAATNAARNRRLRVNRWVPVPEGDDASVTLDSANPYVGEHSPEIHLDRSTPHGIAQTGFALVAGKAYTGRIVLRATAGSTVQVALIWGSGPGDRQTVTIPKLRSDYATFPLKFNAGGSSDAARLEITGTGTGSVHIGAVSLMPADNLQGFRPDTIGLLKQLDSGFWRLPGGNFLSDHSWYDAVGDPDKRPPTFDFAWNAVQPNDVGTDELMTFCRLINVEPYITVNAGLGDAHSAAELVEYANGAKNTHMGAERAKNGHPEPYHIRFWDIGNEPYGQWQIGHTDLRFYVVKHIEFAQAMRAVDPTITLLASGAMPDEMAVEGATRLQHLGEIQAPFGTRGDWTGGLIANDWGYFDGLTEHWYARAGRQFSLEHAKSLPSEGNGEGGYIYVSEDPVDWARRPANRLRVKAEEWDEYKRRFPAMVDKKIFLSIDEWNYSGGTSDLKLALADSMVLNEQIRHTDFLTMNAYTMGLSTLDYTATGATFNTQGLMFQLYKQHFGTLPVEVGGNSPQPASHFPAGVDTPKTPSGSPTYPLDIVAALTPDRRFLTVAVVNVLNTPQKLDLHVTGVHLGGGNAEAWQLSGSGETAVNTVGQPPQAAITRTDLGSVPQSVTVPPISTIIYRLPVAR